MYTNSANLPLPVAIWLATDSYDHDPRPNAISATSLLKPVKSVVLGKRFAVADTEILSLVPSRFGTAVHDSVEMTITHHYKEAMKNLGYPQKVIDSIQINPEPEEVKEDAYIIYLENRHEKFVGDWIITGKYDIVENGQVQDIKTTKTYNWIKGGNDGKYLMQGSIYRWLVPEIITKDDMLIHMMMTDWSPIQAMAKKDYPPRPIMTRQLDLMPADQTEMFIRGKIEEFEDNWDAEQEDMPRCTPEELWQQESTWAYYKNPDKTARATKVFNTSAEAESYKAANGGLVVHRPGEVKFCTYCPASAGCLQAEEYRQQGLLKG